MSELQEQVPNWIVYFSVKQDSKIAQMPCKDTVLDWLVLAAEQNFTVAIYPRFLIRQMYTSCFIKWG